MQKTNFLPDSFDNWEEYGEYMQELHNEEELYDPCVGCLDRVFKGCQGHDEECSYYIGVKK